MYQTYGFPAEVFEALAAEQGLTFDWDGYGREMGEHGRVSGSDEKSGLFNTDGSTQ
jgi:alanyl-tRNA synthetase